MSGPAGAARSDRGIVYLSLPARGLEAFNEYLGRLIAWLTLGTVLMCFAVVVMRYAFNTGVIWMQESYVWMHAIVFLAGAGFTFVHGGHVRVDIFYATMSERRKAAVDLFGTLVFLAPWIYVVATRGYSFIIRSWRIGEPSPQPGGIEYLYLLKTVIWVFCAVIALQGLAVLLRSLETLITGHAAAPQRPGH